MQPATRRPLDGVTVIDLSSYISGPLAGLMLADLGADVIKVEPPRGDPFRRFARPKAAMASVFANANRGKRSVALDLKHPDDMARLHTLLATADVMITNWRPAVVTRLGLDDAALAPRYPRLIRIYVSGFGSTGPAADLPAYDSVIQARAGMTWAEGDDGAPRLSAGYTVDKISATFVAQSTLAALYDRERTGQGMSVEVPMMNAAAYFGFLDYMAQQTYLDEDNADPRFVHLRSQRPLHTADGFIVIACVTGDQIKDACAAMGHPEWAAEVFAIKDSGELSAGFLARLESATSTLSTDAAVAAFTAHDVPVSRCADPDTLFSDPAVIHSGTFEVRDHPALGRVRSVRHPASSPAWGRLLADRPAPMLDEGRADIFGSS